MRRGLQRLLLRTREWFAVAPATHLPTPNETAISASAEGSAAHPPNSSRSPATGQLPANSRALHDPPRDKCANSPRPIDRSTTRRPVQPRSRAPPANPLESVANLASRSQTLRTQIVLAPSAWGSPARTCRIKMGYRCKDSLCGPAQAQVARQVADDSAVLSAA